MSYQLLKLNTNIKRFRKICISMLAVGVTACSTTAEFNKGYTNVTPKFATMLNDNVTIRSAEGEWVLKAGGDALRPEKVNDGGWLTSSLRGKKTDLSDYTKLAEESYDVLIDIDGERKPFYGKLSFSTVPSTASSTDQRAWRIRIPDSYIQQAKGGVVSHIYGTVGYTGRQINDKVDQGGDWSSDIVYPLKKRESTGWILWFSDYPLE